MENQKIINLLDKIDTDSKHFATKKWHIINDENNTNYGLNKNTGTIRGTGGNNNTRLVLKNWAPFTKCNLEINDGHVDTAENLHIVMPVYNLIEYSDNYQDSSATLYQYK